MIHAINTIGSVVGYLRQAPIHEWYVNHLGEKWVFHRAAVASPPGSTCFDLSQLADEEVLSPPGLIYRLEGRVADKPAEERVMGQCSCGTRVVKVLNSNRRCASASGVAYVYPDQTEDSRIFRCRNCHSLIESSWSPFVAEHGSDDGHVQR